ncbi:MAG TPA: ATP-binding protein, partial [Chloroflexia bacterium]|nr:ATP-binding protein [Chloroflexia bacterium]
IEEVVEGVLERLEHRLAAHPVTVAVAEDLPLVQLDFTEIDQVLTNLLENALKYTPPGTPFAIAARRDGDHLEISVADQGPGVAPAHLGYLFDKFYRVQNGQGPDGGTGLGLAISKGLIAAHGGTIWAESPPGAGLTITFTLPIEDLPDAVPITPPLAPAGGSRP